MAQDDAEQEADGAPFIPDPEELRRVAEEVGAQFPPPRLGTELVLLEVDPRRAHAYWNVDLADFESARALTGECDCPMVLRLRDVTAGAAAGSTFDIEVQGLQNHWYIDLWEPGRAYVAELGLRQPDGTLIGIARSNRVDTPRAAQSPVYDTTALDVGDLDVGPVATDLAAAAHAQVDAGDTCPGHVPPLSLMVPPDGDPAPPPAAAVVPPLPPPACPAPPVLQDRYPETSAPVAAPAMSAPATSIPPLPVAPEVGPWPSAEQLVQGLPDPQRGMAELQARPLPPPAPVAVSDGPAVPPASAVAPPAPASAPPAPGLAPPVPLDSYVNLSSYACGRTEVDLEVNVELHIYGRARPGAQLSFYGQRVPLRPDGTFSIRKPLPQGAVVLPLVLGSEPPADTGKAG